ncbi:unnamed protein product [Symbiodinium natans]|uniref:RING-type domain-containing protein n=1 Tax=Symbiodinium natans TaxID=878477 RepID=A0A812V7Z1_9DINO|nr:unnamed protein product [Symbiodinium natans]
MAELWSWLSATAELWSSFLGCQACISKYEEEILAEPCADEAPAELLASDPKAFRCIQCRQLAANDPLYAVVPHEPTQIRGCPHGPFCTRCASNVGKQVLGLCVCRALVTEFRL